MKESLAARQAALLKQNAELNERVVAIEQRRQQQLTGSSSAKDLQELGLTTSGSPQSSNTEPHEAFDDEEHDEFGESDGTAASGRARPGGGNVNLKMDLSASIDSFGARVEEAASLDNAGAETQKSSKPKTRSRGAGSSTTVTPTTLKRQGSVEEKIEKGDEEQAGTIGRTANRRAIETGGSAASGDATANSPDGLGLEATVRYQKARLRVLQDEVDTASSRVKELQGSHGVLKTQIDELRAENGVLSKKCQQTQQLLDKQKELSAAQEAKQRILESQLAAAQAKAEEVQRSEKQASQQFRSKDVRLNRALEELEKVKAQLQEERKAHDKDSVAKSDFELLARENKKLEKQKSELLVAFKKQMKLIDLLKRQRIHMEAAKMLSFTEEEFSKTLELG